jgi:copper ion binding protein
LFSAKNHNPKEKQKNMTTVTYSVPAISCGHCTHTIETEVGELKGVQSVKAAIDTKKVEITFDAPANEEMIKALLVEINYPAEGLLAL